MFTVRCNSLSLHRTGFIRRLNFILAQENNQELSERVKIVSTSTAKIIHTFPILIKACLQAVPLVLAYEDTTTSLIYDGT